MMADYVPWAEVREQSRDFLAPWEPLWGEDALARPTYRARIERMLREWNGDTGYSFHIFATGDSGLPPGQLLGGINLNNVRRLAADAANLGYWMGAPYAGRGLMRSAIGLLLPYAFADNYGSGGLGLHRIDAACIPENVRSRALLRRCGFTQIGLAPAYLRIGGEWRDHICHQLLAEDLAAASDMEPAR
jgi:ribosomal-protein-alanine N-acetyltransferase